METLNDVIGKRFSKSLVCFLKLVDPQKRYKIGDLLSLNNETNA